MTPYFALPESFAPSDYLPFSMRRHHDAARWFVSTIMTKLARRRGLGCVRLRAEFLRRMMGRSANTIVDSLLSGGSVSRSPYLVGSHAFGYVLDNRFAGDGHIRVAVADARMIDRINHLREQSIRRITARYGPVHHKLLDDQQRLRIDGDAARACLTQLPASCNPYDSQGIQIADIERHQFRLSVGRWGRVSNNITSLKRELRDCLRIDGEELAELDLISAQPALLALLIQTNQQITHLSKTAHHRKGTPWPPSLLLPRVCPSLSLPVGSGFEHYRHVVLADDVYSILADVAGVSRTEAKRRFLVDVLAKDGDYPSDVADAFRREFPDIHGFIRAVNRDDHATLIRMLQRLESWLVVEQVCSRLDVPAITLHDAIFATPTTMPTVTRTFAAVLGDLDFPMQWKLVT
jgi:hypothetical protein